MFLKVCARQNILSGLAGGVDPDTHMKWVWLFIDAILMLESEASCKLPLHALSTVRGLLITKFLSFVVADYLGETPSAG